MKKTQSLERAFSILDLFVSEQVSELSMTEIASLTQLNKSTAFGLMATLRELGVLKQNPDNQKYSLGYKLLTYSNFINIQDEMMRIIHPQLVELSRKYKETTHLGTLMGNQFIYIDKVAALDSISINTAVGVHGLLHCTAMGKCLLAFCPELALEDAFSKPLKKMTANTITTREELEKEIEAIRQEGVSYDREETTDGLFCVSVPIFSGDNRANYAISAAGITEHIKRSFSEGLIEDMKDLSKSASKQIYSYEI
ncbi:MAG: IclR family transcriptional regulator [Firmicutes bacterium]|nr:IclR family transcriptional regulator [Bacillota bacterium]